jgi:hypothetical protein
MFVVHLNHRMLVSHWLTDVLSLPLSRHSDIIRLMDKVHKMSSSAFIAAMEEL